MDETKTPGFRILKRGEELKQTDSRKTTTAPRHKPEMKGKVKKTKKNLRVSAPAFVPASSQLSSLSAKTPSPPPGETLDTPVLEVPVRKSKREDRMIVQVWRDNVQSEIEKILEHVDSHPFIAMDTEFPGIVFHPLGVFQDAYDYNYQSVKINVDKLKIIQLGLCFCDEDGNFLPDTCTWQFNFKFDIGKDPSAPDSIMLLTASGVDFKEHQKRGIDVADFASLLTTSGLVLSEDIRWISFHSAYDFAYLLKILTGTALPQNEAEFFDLLKLYFPCFYDVKYLVTYCENLRGGLDKVAESLGVKRIGPQHQAGSDSLLTASIFFIIKKRFFDDVLEDNKHMNVLYGFGQYFRTVKAFTKDVDDSSEDDYKQHMMRKQEEESSHQTLAVAVAGASG